MALYQTWCERMENQQQQYWDEYFAAETENYRKILREKIFSYQGTLAALAGEFIYRTKSVRLPHSVTSLYKTEKESTSESLTLRRLFKALEFRKSFL